ncbi:MAG: hypothetical protein JSV23_08555 [Promethearchaeota archaeon]|nr:MAG: hypothetical protein JSV23_08555 [Candidatus Lokiarchaeota archaeon]
MNRVLKKIRQDNKEFITSEELKKYCKELYFNHIIISNYLISRRYLVKIIDNIYYVKTIDEITQNKLNYSILELVAKALKLKHVENWYYGLYTALKLTNIDYEHQDGFLYLINNRILNNKPIKILGKKFRFLIFKSGLFNFGIINGKVKYSDPEKTVLDLIYLWEYNHINENRILIELSKLLDGISEEKILDYSQYYPESNINILKKALKKI